MGPVFLFCFGPSQIRAEFCMRSTSQPCMRAACDRKQVAWSRYGCKHDAAVFDVVLKEYCKFDPSLNLIGDLCIDTACLNIPKVRPRRQPWAPLVPGLVPLPP